MQALVIDNDLFFTSRIVGVLKQADITPTVTTSMEQISKCLRENPPNWIILNLSLEVLDPIAFVKDLKTKFPAIQVIGYTEHTKNDLMAKAQEAGCNFVVTNGGLFSELRNLTQVK